MFRSMLMSSVAMPRVAFSPDGEGGAGGGGGEGGAGGAAGGAAGGDKGGGGGGGTIVDPAAGGGAAGAATFAELAADQVPDAKQITTATDWLKKAEGFDPKSIEGKTPQEIWNLARTGETSLREKAAAAAADGPDKAGKWPEKWREDMATGADGKVDPKLLKKLQRYDSPKAVSAGLLAADAKIASGTLRTPLKENASEAEVKAYREENGIPDKPEGYYEKLTLRDGVVIGEADKPLINDFMKAQHADNASPAEVSRAINWYYANQQAQADLAVERDKGWLANAQDELRQEWGADFRINQTTLKTSLAAMPDGVGDMLIGARGADGRLLLATPSVVRYLVNLERERNPYASVAPSAGGGAAAAVSTELANLEKMMGDDNSDYWKKGEVGDNLQKRYRELLDASAAARGPRAAG